MKTFAASCAVVILLLALPIGAASAVETPAFPDVPMYDLDTGEAVSVGSFRGKPVVLTFWASWCGPCRAEMPELELMHEELAGRGLVVATVTTDTMPAAAHLFLERLELDLPVYRMDPRTLAKIGISSLPTTILLDPEGRPMMVYEGYTPVTCSDIRKRVEPLLKPIAPDGGS